MNINAISVDRGWTRLGRWAGMALAGALLSCTMFAPVAPTTDQERILAQLKQYEDAVRSTDWRRVASLFDEAGEIVVPGAAPIRGRSAIRSYLDSSSSGKIIAFAVTAESTAVQGKLATQEGTYAQTVAGADAKTASVKGSFHATWARQPDDRWLLLRLQAVPR